MDNKGLLGLEFQYERDLRGQGMRLTPSRDAHGQTIFSDASTVLPDKPGHNLHLTIDRVIQEIAEDALNEGARAAKAKRAFAIVSDPHTGRLLAVANYPSFDANVGRELKLARTRNYAMLDTFEPGSIMKSFVVAAALAKGKTTAHERHNCEKGVYRAGGTVFRDDHPADFLTTTETLIRSSNICTYKIAERMGRNALYELLINYGFGGGLGAGTGFPGTAVGRLSKPDTWKPIRFANIAFGQGLAATGLEVVQAYGAIANGGNLMRPTLVDRVESADGVVLSTNSPEVLRRVTGPDVAKSIRQMLAKVVTDPRGTGSKAATTQWTTAGKTGTSEKVDSKTKRYSEDLRIASFVGFAPVNDPFLVVYVYIDEPAARPAYGGLWAAPVFSKIVERSLRYLNVAPDIVPQKLSSTEAGDDKPTKIF
jgi:cell division protein FtsI (penicillin-binding protein 3)